jgi:hypothetical protein
MAEIELGGFETGGTSSEGGKEVSQEDIVRVNESLGEARKYRGRIGSSIASNSKLAEFIKFLIITISADEFWDGLDAFWIRQDLGEPVFLGRTFVACMLPLYEEKADELELNKEFPLDYHILVTFQNYLMYVQQVFAHDQESRKVDEKKLNAFLKTVVSIWEIKLEEQDSLENMKILEIKN